MAIFPTQFVVRKPIQFPRCECEVGKVEIYTLPLKRSRGVWTCLIGVWFCLIVAGIGSGVLIYSKYTTNNSTHHYQGYCTIPISGRKTESQSLSQNLNVLPVTFSSEPDVRIVNLLGEGSSDNLVKSLREELNIDGSVAKISVFDNGRRVNFTHDFEANFTGIMDDERCFTMDLDPEVVAAPSMFVVGIESDEKFDVSRVRTSLRATIPVLADLPELAHGITLFLDNCLQRPLYHLSKEDGIIIRKRSADEPSHDYIHFSGKHIQEIEITNLPELLQKEQLARARPSTT